MAESTNKLFCTHFILTNTEFGNKYIALVFHIYDPIFKTIINNGISKSLLISNELKIIKQMLISLVHVILNREYR